MQPYSAIHLKWQEIIGVSEPPNAKDIVCVISTYSNTARLLPSALDFWVQDLVSWCKESPQTPVGPQASDQVDKAAPTSSRDSSKGSEAEDGTVNVLLTGYDSRDELYLSDVLMVARFEEDSKEVKLLSIPRDFYVKIPDADEPYQKINAAYAIGGPELAVKTVEELTSISIDHYAAVDFKGFTKAVDAVGGVPVDVEQTYYEKGYSEINLKPGRQTLSGEQALAYVRFRHDPHGDFGRIERQQQLLSALTEEVVSVRGLRDIPELVGVADKYVKNDLSRAQKLTLGWKLYRVQKSGTIDSVTLEGTPASVEGAGSVLLPKDQTNEELLSSFKE